MTLFDYKIAAAIFIFLASATCALYPLSKKAGFKQRESIHLGEALASGIFLGAALLHMLPEAIKIFDGLYGKTAYPIAEAICAFGFLLLLFLERLSSARVIPNHHHSIPYVLAIVLIIHALTEGAALGIGSTLSETIMLFIAIIAHKGSESFALCITLLRHQFSQQRIITVILLFSCMTPLGIGLGTAIHLFTFARSGELIAGIFNAFAAGTFLYISTLHHIHFHQHTKETQGLLEFGCLAAGLLVMSFIAIWA